MYTNIFTKFTFFILATALDFVRPNYEMKFKKKN